MPPPSTDSGPTLRDRKRERTRQTLIEVATDLFERKGYDQTTVAEIAAAADIGARTFFSYFGSKEELLFPDADARVRAAVDAIASRRPDERPAEVLLRALHNVTETGHMTGRLATLRMRLIKTVPAVRGRALQMQLDAQRDIALQLHLAYPDELSEIGAAAMVGAFIGAVVGALQVILERPEEPSDDADVWRDTIRQAIAAALRPWLTSLSG